MWGRAFTQLFRGRRAGCPPRMGMKLKSKPAVRARASHSQREAGILVLTQARGPRRRAADGELEAADVGRPAAEELKEPGTRRNGSRHRATSSRPMPAPDCTAQLPSRRRLSRSLGHLSPATSVLSHGAAAPDEPTLAQRLMQNSMKPPAAGTRGMSRSPVFGTRGMVSSSQVRLQAAWFAACTHVLVAARLTP